MGFDAANAEIARKTLVMFYMIDVSGSMDGTKIATVNDAMRELLPEMKKLSDDNADAVIKLAVMQFSSGAEWITQFPVDFGDFSWIDLQACGATYLGEACRLLNSKLKKDEFLQDKVGNLAPVIILMSDGGPNDDFEGGLAILKENRWFKHAIKIAIAIGDDADKNVLAQFTGSSELVIDAHNKQMLKNMIKFISVSSSTQASSKKGGGTNSDDDAKAAQEKLAEMIQEQVEEENDSGAGTLPAGWV